jgi:hypothetical protein
MQIKEHNKHKIPLGNAIVAIKGRVRDSEFKSIREIKTLCKRIAKYPRPEASGETVKSVIEIHYHTNCSSAETKV